MKLAVSLFVIGMALFLELFSESFFYAKDLYVFSYRLSGFELLILFYIFILSFMSLLFRLKRSLFHKKNDLLALSYLHLFFSFSILYAGEYYICTLFQFVFLSALFRYKYLSYTLYFVFLFYALLYIFASLNYFLYFLNLFALFYFLYKEEFYLCKTSFLVFAIVLSLGALTSYYFENLFYEIYIYLDIVDKVNYLSIEIAYLLSMLHGVIFIIMLIKKLNISRFKIV